MADVRYVCFSDMHFGAENSLFTNVTKDGRVVTDLKDPGPVMKELVICLKLLLKKNANNIKPVLILNGDILELALSTTNQAAMVFKQFINLVLPEKEENLFEKIIFIPGNHDHHLWEIARETQYAEHIKGLSKDEQLKTPWHTTNLFEGKRKMPESYFLKKLLEQFENLENFQIATVYPNFGILDKNKEKGVYFHHGHFIESIYMLMSRAIEELSDNRKPPTIIWDIEAENFAWIDFFWSALGRSGRAGRDVALLYDKMQDESAFKKVLDTLALNITDKILKSWWRKLLNKFLSKLLEIGPLQCIFNKLYDRFLGQEKKEVEVISDKAKKGLKDYIEDPLYYQIISELQQEYPSDVTFIFGHTHKPFEDCMGNERFYRGVKVYNSGGWVVEETTVRPQHGGAMILLDEDLNTVSLRMYNECVAETEYCVKISEILREGEENTEFYKDIKEIVYANSKFWQNFSKTAANAVEERRELLKKRIKEAL